MSDLEINVDDLDGLDEVRLQAEVKKLRAQNAAMVAAACEHRCEAHPEVERLRDEWRGMRDHLRAAAAERDRLRAVLAETPENIEAMIDAYVLGGMARALADQRARAGVEPTP